MFGSQKDPGWPKYRPVKDFFEPDRLRPTTEASDLCLLLLLLPSACSQNDKVSDTRQRQVCSGTRERDFKTQTPQQHPKGTLT